MYVYTYVQEYIIILCTLDMCVYMNVCVCVSVYMYLRISIYILYRLKFKFSWFTKLWIKVLWIDYPPCIATK